MSNERLNERSFAADVIRIKEVLQRQRHDDFSAPTCEGTPIGKLDENVLISPLIFIILFYYLSP